MAKVFIGAGHGGSDPGAVANGFKEKDLNLSIALACRDVLEAHGVTVKMSRTKDENDPYEETFKECNAFAPDVAVEIHNNAGGGDGVEVYHSKRDGSDDALAKNVLNAIVAIGQNSRGVKTRELSDGRAYYAWIRNINAPAVLVECAFMDTKDIEIIDTEAERKVMGTAVAKGILKTLGITYKETAKPVETPTTITATAKVGAGDLVSLTKDAVYYQGWVIPTWVKQHNWYVTEVKGDRAVLGKNQSGYNNINSPVNTKYLTVVQKAKTETAKVETPKPAETPKKDNSALKVGDKVKMSADAVQYGKKLGFAAFVYKSTLYVREISGNRIVVSTQKTGAITGAVHSKYLTKI